MSAEQRVPAWKRLGLSLTNAKDTAPTPASSATSTKRSRDDADTPKGSKKQRLDQNGANVSSPAQKQSQPSSVAPISSPMPSRLRASPEKSILATPNSKQGRRKSVVFSNDTKQQDGDSAQTYFQAWAADELDYYAQKAAAYDAAEAAKATGTNKPQDPTKTESSQPESAPEADSTSEKEEKSPIKQDKKKSKAEKKEAKKEKKQEQSTETNDPAVVKKVKVRTPKDNVNKPVPEYVRYLEQYHTDRPSWKFNKSKQNDLLKNIWNTYRVPVSCNEALVEYLDGLQGSAARQRLRQAAQSANIDIVSFIRSEIPEVKDEPMETLEARLAAYSKAEERQKEILRQNGIDPDPQKTKLLQEQRDYDERVQTVYRIMSKGEPQSAARAAPAIKEESKVDTARSIRKKRKSRTDVSDSESSSSDSDSSSDDDDSDSDSDSDSAGESESENEKPIKKVKADSSGEDEKPAKKKAKTEKVKTEKVKSEKAKIAKLKAQLAKAKIAKLEAQLAKVKAKAGSDSDSSDSSSDSESEDSSSSSEESESDSDSD
ncbi:hypothetical protein AUEXF2481DRAFT_7411 [Aureobasidium subglaciale EXF-2481]|uniref:WKF domain-containing protein n=1 Tax=Aureobasidium subglaciale (strain EXF-2481) TaxID=1043005 RepID=A0A074Z0R5_AURSE|nr:uncharacterized protein AUEXF2481DRAFT_7411 [Aureobasidium subglaciale EXF-2481]KEQ92671.1 hypothetical protein AUEXF2481DRAFT_7411 [Aureobasidium subglaciale EXF-2481]